jgi:hypothetical protein
VEYAMENKIPRILISAVLLALISGIIVSIIGLILGWKTYTQFSDGFFFAGIILIAIGFVNVWGMHNQDPLVAGRQYSPVNNLGRDEGFKLWMADLSRGYNTMIFMGISGLLLFGIAGLAILVGRLF